MLVLFIAVCFLAAGAGADFTSSSVSNRYLKLRKPPGSLLEATCQDLRHCMSLYGPEDELVNVSETASGKAAGLRFG